MLDQLTITNFKAFANADVRLSSFTLLSGRNSTGKSTVLQALALLRQSQDLLTDDNDGGFLLNGDLVELGAGQDVLHENYILSGTDSEPRITLSVRSGSSVYSWTVAYEREGDLLRLVEHSGPDSREIPAVFAPGFQYLRADRISPAVTYPRSHEIAIRQGFLGARGEYTVDYLRSFQDELVEDERLHHSEAQSPRLLHQAEAWMQAICPGVNLRADAIEGTDFVRLSFRFGTGLSSSNWYRPTNVGFGLTYVLPVVIACLTARPGGLVLVENPEAHLHPRGQTAMATLTCAASAVGAQLVVETHSEHVLNGVRLAVKRGLISADRVRLHFFRGTEDPTAFQIVTPVLGRDGMISEWPAEFFDEWERSLDKLLD
jgi:predicted ATPase